jgi:hypothetical protein
MAIRTLHLTFLVVASESRDQGWPAGAANRPHRQLSSAPRDGAKSYRAANVGASSSTGLTPISNMQASPTRRRFCVSAWTSGPANGNSIFPAKAASVRRPSYACSLSPGSTNYVRFKGAAGRLTGAVATSTGSLFDSIPSSADIPMTFR